MEESMKKTRERLMDEFRQASSSQKWDKDNIEMMKDLLKAVYYMDVICAMEEGSSYPGEEYTGSSYARGGRGRNSYDSRGGSYDGRGSYGYRGGMSGRRYYDDEMGEAVHKLEHMMDIETNPEKRMAIRDILGELQMR